MIAGLTPPEIVERLNEYIVGQEEAKKAVAIALRNRNRRMALGNDPLQEEIHPKNIIMIGPTGVGKTEIARRLARLVQAPFLKVEASKYTEVGYVGRDVESMVRDLAHVAVNMVRAEFEEKVREEAARRAEEKIIDVLLAGPDQPHHGHQPEDGDARALFRKKLHLGTMEDREIEIMVTAAQPNMQIMAVPGMEDMENQLQNALGSIFPRKKNRKKTTIAEARKIFEAEETELLLDHDKIKEEAVRRCENSGIIFVDEIDKIASHGVKGNIDVSREGVQRDILPLVEGTIVNTRIGQINTEHILFIAAGAFHVSSISDLIPELQGRFPIRVELKPLNREDYLAILQSPRNALAKQYQALLSTEEISLQFEASGLRLIADIAYEMNQRNENIGARRLYTIMERLLEDLSFHSDQYRKQEIVIDEEYVKKQLADVVKNQDLSRFVL